MSHRCQPHSCVSRPLRRVLEANRKCRPHQCCAPRLRLRVARLTGSEARVHAQSHGGRQKQRRHGDPQDYEATHAAQRDSLHVSPLSLSPVPAHMYTHLVSPGGCL
jgi:hypothetical protein